jgi:hypothetical protein
VEGERSCGIEQPGFEEETVQEARVEISRKEGGMGKDRFGSSWRGEPGGC